MATIIIRNSTGSGAVPSSLVQGELAINTKDGKLFYGSGSGNIVKEFTGSGGGGGAAFPFTGSALITGSLNVIGNTTITGSVFISSSNATQLLVGNNLLFISGSSNIGIGTSTPDSYYAKKLVVSAVDEDGITIAGTTTSATNYLAFADGTTGNQAYRGYVAYKHLTDQLAFGTGGTLRATIDNSGNFGVGTSTNTILARTHIQGSGATSATTALRVENSNTSASLVVLDNGYVGIGTSSAQYQLDLYGSYHQYQAQGQIARYDISSANANQNRGIWDFYTNAAVTPDFFGRFGFKFEGGTADSFKQFQVHVADSTTPKFVVDGSGRMGIGTITPSSKLHISGSTTEALLIASSSNGPALFVSGSGNVGIGTTTPAYKLDVSGSTRFKFSPSGSDLFTIDGATTTRYFIVENSNGFVGIGNGYTTSATPATSVDIRGNTSIRGGSATVGNAFIVTNTTPTTLLTVQNNGQVSFTSPTMSLAASQSAFSISPIISASNVVGGQYYGVSITPTFFQTTGSQTETAFRVAATFTASNASAATGGTNIIADFGSTSAGSQLTVTDVTSGSIYMVNDVSGIPIIEATSNWNVNIYDFPNKVFEKTGSQVNIYGTMRVSGSFILPLSQSVTPQTGSAYWSGSLLFIYDGTRYRSSSFA